MVVAQNGGGTRRNAAGCAGSSSTGMKEPARPGRQRGRGLSAELGRPGRLASTAPCTREHRPRVALAPYTSSCQPDSLPALLTAVTHPIQLILDDTIALMDLTKL